MDVADLIAELNKLPESSSPWFPIRLNDLVFKGNVARDDLGAIVTDSQVALDVRFKALYGFLNRARRERDISVYDEYIAAYGMLFPEQEFPMVLLLRSQANLNHLQCGDYSDRYSRGAMKFAQDCSRLLPHHFGVASHFSAVVSVCEGRLEYESRDISLIEQCIQAQEFAILSSSEQNPKYHATRAKLFMLVRRWDEGLAEIAKAIDTEDSRLTDYPIRIGEYGLVRAEIESERRMQTAFDGALGQLKAVRDESIEIKKGLQDVQGNTLTLVGLLAAIVAFITTSTSVIAKLEVQDAIRIVIMSSGSMLVVFSGILWLTSTSSGARPAWKYLAVAIAGLILVTVSLTLA